MSTLSPAQISALLWKLYRFKGKMQRKTLCFLFKKTTEVDLTPALYGIPIVKQLLELTE
ncbi:MAG: hypothetical protein N2558_01465 [Patescibacteria group bacterium]|nr:hypothetical protein [Patescibacteria group bacterium]